MGKTLEINITKDMADKLELYMIRHGLSDVSEAIKKLFEEAGFN